MKRKIFIIIIIYNNHRVIINCLKSLNQQSYQNFEVLIVDNNSTDNTVMIIQDYLKKHQNLSKKIRVIKNKINSGFSKAVNIGLKEALDKKNIYAALLLNPDIYFTHDLLKNGINILETNPDAGAAVPKILYSDKRIWWVGTRIFSDKELLQSSKYGIAEHINKGQIWQSNKSQTNTVEAITGCALFLRMTAVKEVGLFNEKYFMYAEDIDYSQRLKQKGYSLLMFSHSTVFHEVRDRKMNMHVVFSSLRKYKIYLTSVGIYLLIHKPRHFFFIWFLKLPYALTKSYFEKTKI
jgi:GT2 family glycosyltransferase